MGHYFAQEYQISSHAEDANKAIDFLKKAFTLDPNSQQIGDELAEIYYQSQRIRDAVTEANSILAKDPDNLPARRLLARIYVRTLGDLSNTSGQRDTSRTPPSNTAKSCAWIPPTPMPRSGSRACTACKTSRTRPKPFCETCSRANRQMKMASSN